MTGGHRPGLPTGTGTAPRPVAGSRLPGSQLAVLLVLLLSVLLLPVRPAVAAAPTAPAPAQLVVVGVAGLRWEDVSAARTPALAALASRGAVGVLSVKAVPAVSCPADGWLSLGAGARAESYGVARDPCDAALPAATAADVTRNADSPDGAVLGALGAVFGSAAAAQGPGAGLALATAGAGGVPSGTVPAETVPAGTVPAGAVPAGTGPARVRVLDAGTLGRGQRDTALARADLLVRQAAAALPAGGDLLVVGLAEGAGEREARLHVAIGSGPDFPRGALRSASTRRSPYVQLIDVAPTVFTLLGVAVPKSMAGQPWQVAGPAPTPAQLVDLDRKAVAHKRATVPFFVVLIAAQVGLLAALRRRPGGLRAVALAGVAAPGASYLANLLPWWRAHPPLAVLLAVVLGISAAAAVAVRRRRHAVGLLCAGTALVLVVDLLTGARLQMGSVAGYSALVAGRFAGLGNVAFGVYAAAALLATASLAPAGPRRATAGWVAAAGLVAVAVDGAPPWGSDVGGVLALLPAFVVLGLLLTGTRVSVLRLAAAGLAGVAVVAVFAGLDYARPPARRTHLGRFVGQLRDGTAGEVLSRKAGAVFRLLFHSPVTAALPLVVAAAVLLVVRPPPALRATLDGCPALRAALTAVAVVAALGFAVNDSGAAVVALALLQLAPAVAAVTATAPAARTGTPEAATTRDQPDARLLTHGAADGGRTNDTGPAGGRRAAGQGGLPSA